MQRAATRMSEFIRASRTGDPAARGVVASQPWWVLRATIFTFLAVAIIPLLIVFAAASAAAIIVFAAMSLVNAIGQRLRSIGGGGHSGRENVRIIPPDDPSV